MKCDKHGTISHTGTGCPRCWEEQRKRITELEQQLGDLCQDEHLRIQELEAALREIRHQLWLNSQITGPMTNFARKIDEIAKQALKQEKE